MCLSTQHMQLFAVVIVAFTSYYSQTGGADTGNRWLVCGDWIRGVIIFCCRVHLAPFSHLPAVCFYIIGVLQSFLKGAIQSICASLCAQRTVFGSAAAQHSLPPVWTLPLFNNSIKLHDYQSNDAKQTGDNNIFIALAARQCHPSLRMMPHDIVYHVYQPWSLQT